MTFELRSVTGATPRRINVHLKKRTIPPELSLIQKEITDKADEFVDRGNRIRVILRSLVEHSDHASLEKILDLCVDLVEDEIESEVKYAEEVLKWGYYDNKFKVFGIEYDRGKYFVEYGYKDFNGQWKSKWQQIPNTFEKEMAEKPCC